MQQAGFSEIAKAERDDIPHRHSLHSFLGPLPCIASLSLGSSRDFQMKHKTEKVPVEKWALQSGASTCSAAAGGSHRFSSYPICKAEVCPPLLGDCVVMRGTTQSKWLHSVPKRANAGPRMNLTFRRAMNTGGTNNYYR